MTIFSQLMFGLSVAAGGILLWFGITEGSPGACLVGLGASLNALHVVMK